jgi:hypothetical protein
MRKQYVPEFTMRKLAERWLIAAGCCSLLLGVQAAAAQENSAKREVVSKYGDGKADGKRSIAGTGEMIRFKLPSQDQQLRGLRVHCARYGHPQAPNESAEISIVNADGSEVLHQEQVPYSQFKRGDSRWTMIKFEEPVEVTDEYWVILDFNAEQTKGVYVSFDTSTGGQHSKTGVPGGESEDVKFGGDWMVQALLTRP